MKTRIFTILLCMLLAFTLVFAVACSKDDENDDSGSTNTETSTDTATDTSTETDTSTDTSTDDEPQVVMHTVTFVLDNGEANIVKTVQHGKLTLGVPKNISKPGCTFDGWVANGTSWDENSPIEADITVTAVWVASENVLIFNPNCDNATGDELDALTIKTGDKVTLPTNTLKRQGYNFMGWATTENGEVAYADGAEYTMGPDAQNQLYAVWEAKQYQIVYTLDDDVVNHPDNPSFYTVAEVVTLKNPTREGWIFKGWKYDDNPFIDTEGSVGAIELTATWVRVRYGVVYKYNDVVADYKVDKGENPTDLSVEDVVTLAPAICNGFKFEGWYSDAEFTTPVTKLENVENTVNLFGKFSKETYTVTYNLPQGVTNSADNIGEFDITTEFTFLAPTVDVVGYEFDGWYVNGEKVEGLAKGSYGNVTVEAALKPIVYTITYSGAESGFLPEGTIYEYTVESEFDKITLPTIDISGITFNGWYSDEALGNKITEITLDKTAPANITVYLSVEFTKYNIEYKFPEGMDESIFTNPNRKWYADSVTVEFAPVTAEGYKCLGFYAEATYENLISSTKGQTGDITIYVKIESVVTQIGKDQVVIEDSVLADVTGHGNWEVIFDGNCDSEGAGWYHAGGWGVKPGYTAVIELDKEYTISTADMYIWSNSKTGYIEFFDAEGNSTLNFSLNWRGITDGSILHVGDNFKVKTIKFTKTTAQGGADTIQIFELILKVDNNVAEEE